MKRKHVLFALVAMLGLAFVFPSSMNAQKKKKEKKPFVWELPAPSGDATIDEYLLSCDTLYNKITLYKESMAHYEYKEETFAVGDKNYFFKCMIDPLSNKFLSRGMGRWQVAQGILAGTNIILDATSLSLQTASAGLALPNLGLGALSYGKLVTTSGPRIIAMGMSEMPKIKKECQNTMRKYNTAVDTSILSENLDPAVRDYLMAQLGIDASTLTEWYGKYIFVSEATQEAAVAEKTDAEKDAGNALLEFKDFGTADLPGGTDEPNDDEMNGLLG